MNTPNRGRKAAAALAAVAAGALAAVAAVRLIKSAAADHTARRAGGHIPGDAGFAISPVDNGPHREDSPLAVISPKAVDGKSASPAAMKPAVAAKASRHRTVRSQDTTFLPNAASKIQPGQGRSKQPRHGGVTRQQLYEEARKRNIRGRSAMTKAELLRALS